MNISLIDHQTKAASCSLIALFHCFNFETFETQS